MCPRKLFPLRIANAASSSIFPKESSPYAGSIELQFISYLGDELPAFAQHDVPQILLGVELVDFDRRSKEAPAMRRGGFQRCSGGAARGRAQGHSRG